MYTYTDETTGDSLLVCDTCYDDLHKKGLVESKRTRKNSNPVTESYRRTVSRGKSLIDNDLFVDFE
jgi:hypothetical protein